MITNNFNSNLQATRLAHPANTATVMKVGMVLAHVYISFHTERVPQFLSPLKWRLARRSSPPQFNKGARWTQHQLAVLTPVAVASTT